MLIRVRLCLSAVLLWLAACTPDDHAVREQSLPVPPTAPAYAVRVLPNADGTFGYEVSRDAKPLIRQLTVPGRAGTRGFPDSIQARRVAALVVQKLGRGLLPP